MLLDPLCPANGPNSFLFQVELEVIGLYCPAKFTFQKVFLFCIVKVEVTENSSGEKVKKEQTTTTMCLICLRNGRLMQVFGKNQSKKLILICLSDLCPNYTMVWYSGEGLASKMF